MTYDEIYEQLQAEYDRVIADTLDRLKKEKPLTKKKLAKELFKANKAYWAARLALLDTDAVAEADALAASLAMPYAAAAGTFSDRVRNIYAGYQSAFDLSQKDAKELLKHVVYDRTIAENLKAVAEEMTDEEEKQRILAEISAPAYRYRLQRAEKLTRQAKDVCDRIAGSEIEADRGFLQTQIEKAYNITVDEVLGKPPSEAILDEILPEPIQLRFNEMPKASEPVQEFSPTTDKGILDSFSVISDERVREIAGTDWSGREFSESVWNNTDDLAKEIKQVLIEGELTGASEGKMSEKIVERFGVAMHKARRVVRTEQNYCINQTELKGMLDAGYDEYEFASLGEEAEGVCDTCDDLDGMRFKIADAVVGVNCPPMHPFCRCKVTTPVQTVEDIRREIDERIESWNIPEGMSFDEFVERVNNGELEQIREEQNTETVSETNAIFDFESRYYTSDTEHGLVVYPDGTTKEFGGDEHTVMGDKSELSKMEGATFTHNHPSGVTFSTTDINNGIVTGNLSELRAVTPSGEVHILHNNGASIGDRRKFNALYSENQKKAINIANSKISRGEVFDKEAFVSERKEKWLIENAEKYGLSYEKKTLDFSEKSGIMEVGKEETTENDMLLLSSKFINPNDDLYRYADRIIPENGFGDIICHGDPFNLLIRGMDGEEWAYPADKAAEMIRNSREFKKEPIRLISCQTGAEENGIAQQLANILGVDVKAPTESVYINMNGEMFITDNDILARLWDKGLPVKETGEWKVFKPKGE